MTSDILIAVVAAGLTAAMIVGLLMLRHVRKMLPGRQGPPLAEDSLAQLADLAGQLDLLVKDLNSKLDDRMARLDEAIRQADQKLDQLHQASQHLPGALDEAVESEAAGRPIWEEAGGEATPSTAPHADGPAEDDLVTLPGTWPLAPQRPGQQASPSPTRNHAKLQSRRHVEVMNLHRQGLTEVDIARKLQMDVGEVELVLNLNRSGPAGA